MLLVCDAGNTGINTGIWDNDVLILKFRCKSDKLKTEAEYTDFFKETLQKSGLEEKITQVGIASVVPELTDKLVQAFKQYKKIDPFTVTKDINFGVKTYTDNPGQIGADRISNAYGASLLYGNPVLVVDFGTATTFDTVDKNNAFIGGIIAPGLRLQIDSLSSNTALLPEINLEVPKKNIGTDTIEEMLSGIVNGHAAMVDGMIENFERELGYKLKTVASGGYSRFITGLVKRKFDFINPDLTLFGIKELYRLNN